MRNAFFKDIIRSIRHSYSRFLSIFGIVLLGAGTFAGIAAVSHDMQKTGDLYYDNSNVMDIRLLSTYGFTEDDVMAIRNVENVLGVMPTYSIDAVSRINGKDFIFRIHGLPDNMDEESNDYINRPILVEGDWPRNPGECVLLATPYVSENVQIGDTITLRDTDGDLWDNLKYDTYKITGFVKTPYYISYIMSSSSKGRGSVDYVMYVQNDNFALNVYTDLYVTVADAKALNAFSDEYEVLVEKVAKDLEQLSLSRTEARYNEIIAEASEELENAKKEYEEKKDEAYAQLDEGLKKIEEARNEIATGEKELQDGQLEYEKGVEELAKKRAEFNQEMDNAQAEIDSGRQQIEDGWKQVKEVEELLLAKKEELEQNRKDVYGQFEQAQKILDDARVQLEEGRKALDDGQKQLSEAYAKYEQEKAQAESMLEEARLQLQSAYDQIATRESEYTAGKNQYDAGIQELNSAEAQLKQLKDSIEEMEGAIKALEAQNPYNSQLPEMRRQLTVMRQQYETGLAGLNAKRAELEAAGKSLEEARAQLDAAWAVYRSQQEEFDRQKSAMDEQLAQARKELDEAKYELERKEIEWQMGMKEFEQKLAEYESQKREAEQKLAEAEQQIADGFAELNGKKEQLIKGEDELNRAQAELDSARKEALAQFEEAQRELDEAAAKLAEGREKLEEGKLELARAEREYAEKKAEVDEKLAEAREKIEEGEKEIAQLKKPKWYVFDREGGNEGFSSFKADTERMHSLSSVFPVIFLLVAAMVALTTMTRMVDEERIIIGTYKALGYSNIQIAAKYLVYAAIASISGSIIGILIGFQVLPTIVWNTYGILYALPPLITDFYWSIAVIAAIVCTLCTLAATSVACYSTLKEIPARLMLPRAPKPGKRVFLEHIRPVWSRLSFSQKATVRNLFLNKKRLVMSVIGIAGCTALLLTGFGIDDAVSSIIDNQFKDIFRYNVIIGLTENEVPDQARAFLDDPEYFTDSIMILQKTVEVIPGVTSSGKSVSGESDTASDEQENKNAMNAYLVVPKDEGRIGEFIELRDRKSRRYLEFDGQSVIISEKLSEKLRLGVGDKISIQFLDSSDDEYITLTVTDITENYTFNYIYVAPEVYEKAFGEEPGYNFVMGKATEDHEVQQRISEGLLEIDGISTVMFTRDMIEKIEDSIKSVDRIIFVLTVLAGMLAFIVLYNFTNINVGERQRELATIKVLGFFDNEVDAYIYRETVAITVIGCILGLVGGIFLHRKVIETVEVDMVMFGRSLHAVSYVWAAVLTMLFSLIVNFAIKPKIRKINMIESLKSVD